MNLIQKLFSRKERKIIHDLASKPKIRKRFYNMWKCGNEMCGEEFYFQPLRCPICMSDIREVKKYTTLVEYPITKYV